MLKTVLLAKPPTGVTPETALHERACRFFAGEFESLWDEHKWENKLPTMESHAKQEAKPERERGEELVAFIQDAARKRRLRQAMSRMLDVPSVPPGDLAHAQLRKLLCADVLSAERATMLRWREERGMNQPENAMRRLGEDLRDKARVKELEQLTYDERDRASPSLVRSRRRGRASRER